MNIETKYEAHRTISLTQVEMDTLVWVLQAGITEKSITWSDLTLRLVNDIVAASKTPINR